MSYCGHIELHKSTFDVHQFFLAEGQYNFGNKIPLGAVHNLTSDSKKTWTNRTTAICPGFFESDVTFTRRGR